MSIVPGITSSAPQISFHTPEKFVGVVSALRNHFKSAILSWDDKFAILTCTRSEVTLEIKFSASISNNVSSRTVSFPIEGLYRCLEGDAADIKIVLDKFKLSVVSGIVERGSITVIDIVHVPLRFERRISGSSVVLAPSGDDSLEDRIQNHYGAVKVTEICLRVVSDLFKAINATNIELFGGKDPLICEMRSPCVTMKIKLEFEDILCLWCDKRVLGDKRKMVHGPGSQCYDSIMSLKKTGNTKKRKRKVVKTRKELKRDLKRLRGCVKRWAELDTKKQVASAVREYSRRYLNP